MAKNYIFGRAANQSIIGHTFCMADISISIFSPFSKMFSIYIYRAQISFTLCIVLEALLVTLLLSLLLQFLFYNFITLKINTHTNIFIYSSENEV